MIILSIILAFALICACWRCRYWRRKWEKENEFAGRLCVEERRSHTYGLHLYNALQDISQAPEVCHCETCCLKRQEAGEAILESAQDIARKVLKAEGLPLCYLYNEKQNTNKED